MRAMVLLQTVCNTLVRGQRLFQQYCRFVDLKEDSGEEVRVFIIDGWSWDGILRVGWSNLRLISLLPCSLLCYNVLADEMDG